MISRILLATDLSFRSELAMARAVLLARQYRAELTLLHVVDEDQPGELVQEEVRQIADLLNRTVSGIKDTLPVQPEIMVEKGDPFLKISEVARQKKVELLVMGSHRKQILKDIFTGTTLERVLRTSELPVLVVNREAGPDYQHALLATDLSEISAQAARIYQSLGFDQIPRLSVLHAFFPMGKDMMTYAGISQDHIAQHVGQSLQEARNALDNFMQESGLAQQQPEVLLREGPAFQIIEQTVADMNPDLLIMGTHGHGSLTRLLLGSIADAALRELDCDILVVPRSRSR